MKAVSDFFDLFFGELAKADFALLAIIDFSAFAALCIAVILCCALSPKIRAMKKRPFLHVLNAFAAITLVIFLTDYPLAQSAAAACIFWFTGYLVYGSLYLFKKKKRMVSAPLQEAPVQPSKIRRPPYAPAPAPSPMTGEVRLEHAMSIADKLLLKNLGRGDRQELEKIKTTLTVLKVKESLSPQEGETLNEMFNALLKLMARYDL